VSASSMGHEESPPSSLEKWILRAPLLNVCPRSLAYDPVALKGRASKYEIIAPVNL
ncbi:hypothetical protein L7F22_012811, partial [Adiantum nelumboides]|nr:hypothetical protein [Adiantum nelumboides]